MSGRRVCEINVYVNISVTRSDCCGDCFSQLWTGKKCEYSIWASYHFNLGIIKPWCLFDLNILLGDVFYQLYGR